jgi:CHAT domain-containing protein
VLDEIATLAARKGFPVTAPRRAKNKGQLLRELASLTSPEAQEKFLVEHRSLLRPEVVSEIADHVREQVRIDVQQASRMAESAVAIARQLNNKESMAWALRAKANVLYVNGEPSAAVDLHRQSVALFEAVGKADEVARTLSGSIQPLLQIGEYDRAIAAAERARKIFAEQRNIWRLARLEINIGNIYYRQDRFAEALTYYQRAREGLKHQDDAEGTAAVLSNLITCYMSLNDFPRSLDAYAQARQFCEENGMPLLVTQADYNIAYLYYLRGEYSKAIEMLRSARVHAQAAGDGYHAALCNLDLAELYLELNLSAEAAELAQLGYEGFCKLGIGYEAGKCLAFIAIAATQKRQSLEALDLFSQAREVFVREKNHVWPPLIDLYCALVFFNDGRFADARELCQRALDSFPALNLWNKTLLAQLLLARIALQTKEVDEALGSTNAALQSLVGTETPVLAYQAHLVLGDIYKLRGVRDSAYTSYQSARQALETLRGGLRGEELKIAFVKNRLEVYENLVELSLERGGDATATEEAFTYIEQAKSRSLMDLFAQPPASLSERAREESEFAQSIRELRAQLNWCYKQVEREQLQPGPQSAQRIASLQEQAQNREKELMRLLREAPEEDALQAGFRTPTHVPIAAIRAAIPPDTLLVEYFKVRDRIVACVLGPKTLRVVPVTLETKIASLLRLLQFQLSKLRLAPEYIEAFRDSLSRATQAHLKELYAELIAPVAPLLNAGHLVVVPHGLLHYVPFHALFDGSQHLIDRYTISYSPSASIYALCQSRIGNSSGSPLILGIPDSQAPAIQEEVEAIASALDGAELFVGPDATEQVLRKKGPESRMIHIATHGRFRQDNPMFSTIRLGDSFLTLFDLYLLKLPAELVTLSGCSTGMSTVASGDELVGLARGLLHAGAQSLVLSLWDVPDQSTAEFMKVFYRFLKQGQSKAVALRAAMLEIKSRYPHCYQWAPFILVGKA